MRLLTIWTTRHMSLRERISRTQEWGWQTAAEHLPRKLAYWSYIHVGVQNILNDELVPGVPFLTILERITLDASERSEPMGTSN